MYNFLIEYSGFCLNWILNWIIFRHDSMKKWIFKTDRLGLCLPDGKNVLDTHLKPILLSCSEPSLRHCQRKIKAEGARRPVRVHAPRQQQCSPCLLRHPGPTLTDSENHHYVWPLFSSWWIYLSGTPEPELTVTVTFAEPEEEQWLHVTVWELRVWLQHRRHHWLRHGCRNERLEQP